MSQLRPFAGVGRGNVGVILPGTSPSLTALEAHDLTLSLEKAGLSLSRFTVQSAGGSDAIELNDSQTAITKGASVLIVDPLSSTVGAAIEKYAMAHGVLVIDYDRLTLGGSRQYYVGFSGVKVGTLLGQGLVHCIRAWHVKNPNVLVTYGNPADNNARLYGNGYNKVLDPLFKSGTFRRAGRPAGTWSPPAALSEFRRQLTADPSINALLAPSDENAAPVIKYLRSRGVGPRTFPVTGQNATPAGLRAVLAGYQCGTVYRPVYKEAEAAAALAIYLRAGIAVPTSLTGGSTIMDTASQTAVPSVLLTPTWVTPANMNSTVIADKFASAAQLCTGRYMAACKAAGIPG
jgi:D-xylose transport system substrate-binding protein